MLIAVGSLKITATRIGGEEEARESKDDKFDLHVDARNDSIFREI